MLAVASCGHRSSDDHPRSTNADEPVLTGEPPGHNAADVDFTDEMIVQDQLGSDISSLVPNLSTNPAVVAFAAAGATARQSDIQVLKVLQVQWNSNSDNQTRHEPDATRFRTIDPATIAKLRSSHGGEFDTLWLQSMLGLDRRAIQAANVEIAGGNNVDAVGVARQLVDARQAELGQIKTLLGS